MGEQSAEIDALVAKYEALAGNEWARFVRADDVVADLRGLIEVLPGLSLASLEAQVADLSTPTGSTGAQSDA